MTGEYVKYNAPKNTLTVEQSLELQRWITDPDSRPYERGDVRLLTVRSASLENEKAKEEQSFMTIQKMLEIRDMILES